MLPDTFRAPERPAFWVASVNIGEPDSAGVVRAYSFDPADNTASPLLRNRRNSRREEERRRPLFMLAPGAGRTHPSTIRAATHFFKFIALFVEASERVKCLPAFLHLPQFSIQAGKD